MTEIRPDTRKTRFVCVSDTHNASPGGAFRLPEGDVLIHAGDMTNQGSFSELEKTVKWIKEADFEAKVVIAGNHDITLDACFYAQYGLYFHNQNPQSPEKCHALLEGAKTVHFLNHEAAVIDLLSPTGPRTTFKIFGSPFSPANGMWAFGYGQDEATRLWDKIPLDSDIVVTHTPPKYHCDERKDRRSAGCEALRNALWRVRPKLAICGHIHEGRGAQRILWDLGCSNVRYKESGVDLWHDSGHNNKKLSILDLSTKGSKPIKNNGSIGDVSYGRQDTVNTSRDSVQSLLASEYNVVTSSPTPRSESGLTDSLARLTTNLLAVPSKTLHPATYGQGGTPPSQRCDIEALSGRMGRQETCVVNAAIMASSWPHGPAGKKFNKPIVIDIDLPIWNT